jgi:hypothetical protein
MIKLFLSLSLLLVTLPAQEAAGVVYVDRVEEARRGESKNVSVYLDGQKALSMPEQEFIALRLKPGRYVFDMKTKATVTPVVVEAGKTYYLRASQTAPFGYVQNLYRVEEEQAREQMRGMKPLQRKNIKLKELDFVEARP